MRGRPAAPADATATTDSSPVPGSPTVLPPVKRRAVMPAGFKAGGLAAGIKASGRPDLAVAVTTLGPAAAAVPRWRIDAPRIDHHLEAAPP